MTVIQNLSSQFQEIYNGSPWIDESFDKKLAVVNEENAFIRPFEGMHSVAEILSHLLIWRTEIMSRLEGNPKRISMSSPENWKGNKVLKKESWAKLVNEFKRSQEALIQLLESKNDDFLSETFDNTDNTYKYFLEGLLHHDLYHLGQIGIVLKYIKH